MALIDFVRIYKNYTFPTQVLVASVRHPIHFVRAAELGAHVAICPFNVISQSVNHPLTDIGLNAFSWITIRQSTNNLSVQPYFAGTYTASVDRPQTWLYDLQMALSFSLTAGLDDGKNRSLT
jgi:hypothetical protein